MTPLCVSPDPPRHPLFNTPIVNPAQIHPMIIKVLPDADHLYSQDTRFVNVTAGEKQVTLGVLSKLRGEQYAVTGVKYYESQPFYVIRVLPAFNINTAWGQTVHVNAAVVPADYTELVRGIRCPEAK